MIQTKLWMWCSFLEIVLIAITIPNFIYGLLVAMFGGGLIGFLSAKLEFELDELNNLGGR